MATRCTTAPNRWVWWTRGAETPANRSAKIAVSHREFRQRQRLTRTRNVTDRPNLSAYANSGYDGPRTADHRPDTVRTMGRQPRPRRRREWRLRQSTSTSPHWAATRATTMTVSSRPGYAGDAAHVDADHWEDQAETRTAPQPLVAGLHRQYWPETLDLDLQFANSRGPACAPCRHPRTRRKPRPHPSRPCVNSNCWPVRSGCEDATKGRLDVGTFSRLLEPGDFSRPVRHATFRVLAGSRGR